jgi:hypothetical protein
MGANFFVKPPGVTSDDPDDWIHLGKSSAGWAFTFRAYPDPGTSPEAVTWPVGNVTQWMRLLYLGEIRDEYGKPYTREELLRKIEAKRLGRHHGPASKAFRDDQNNDFIPVEFC